MAKYLISFPSAAMIVPDGEWEAVGRDAHAVIDEAKAAGVYVFGGGIDEDVPPVLVSADGKVAQGGYSWAPPLDGGFTRPPAFTSSAAVSTKTCRPFSSRPTVRSPREATRGRPHLTAVLPCSNYPHARRPSCGPRASRRPAAATKSYASSGSTRSPESVSLSSP